MTDIQQARDILAKWRTSTTSAPWAYSGEQVYSPFSAYTVGNDVDDDDARLIVGTAGNPDLLEAIDGLLAHVWKYPAWTNGHMRTYAERIAAAIIAADERMTS